MAGFSNDVMYASNVRFDGGKFPGAVTTNGQLLIGSTVAPNIRVGTLTSTGGTITITPGAGTINLDVAGGTLPIDSIQVQAFTGPGTNPVVPDVTGLMFVNGAAVAAQLIPVRSNSLAVNTYQIEVQRASTSALTNATQQGIASFNSAQFVVDANGFVSTAAVVATSYPTDAGTAIPAAGVLNILGGPGITTTGVGNTVTINSVIFTDQGGSVGITSDSGSFVSGAGTITLTCPAAPLQGEELDIGQNGATTVVVQANAGQTIRIGNQVSSVAGTATSLSANGDALILRFRAANAQWMAFSSVGNWNLT